VLWLEEWLRSYPGTLLVISHDREFLDGLCTHTLHLHEGKAKTYVGGYTAFERQRAEHLRLQQIAHEKEQVERAHLQAFIDRFKAKASKAKQAQSRVKALARMEKLAPVLTSSDFEFEFREPQSLPNPMLSFDLLDCGYGQTAIVKGFSRSVLAGQDDGDGVASVSLNHQGAPTVTNRIESRQ
jgi:ATP-binding cassette subfamily F protein 3